MAKKIVIVDVEETLEDKVNKYRTRFHIMSFVSLFLILGFIICETKSTEKLFQEMNKNNNNYDDVLDESDYFGETDFISNAQVKNNVTNKVKSNTNSNKIDTQKVNDVVSTIKSNFNVEKIIKPVNKTTKTTSNKINNAIEEKVVNDKVVSSFENDSWDAIVLNVKNGNSSNYKIGDTKKIDLNIDGEVKTYNLVITNNSIEEGCNEASQANCGFVLEFKDTLYLNNDESVEWENSVVRNYLNETLYELLPSTIKDNIIETKIVLNDAIVSSDKIYVSNIEEVLTSSEKIGVKPIFRIG